MKFSFTKNLDSEFFKESKSNKKNFWRVGGGGGVAGVSDFFFFFFQKNPSLKKEICVFFLFFLRGEGKVKLVSVSEFVLQRI